MATLAQPRLGAHDDKGFFLGAALVMTAVMVAGFGLNIVIGRSSFGKPLLVHAHAVVFFGWVFLYLAQNFFVASGRIALHRALGWIGAFWVVPMLILGTLTPLARVQAGTVAFFFAPLQFLVYTPATLAAFALLTYGAIALRRHSDWHRRLHFCGMALLTGPGLGRLLPLPLLIPYALEATFAVQLLFPLAGMIADGRRGGRIHPAWYWGMGMMVGSMVVIELITFSPLGLALYGWVTAGHLGASVPPLAFPPPPAP
ncbi:MAG: hypothetical protein A4S12_05715 [Proteobacteria bacterium SG_bin5]|nr:MAG: hypothetical protein A4S12_05715 [Proteobacteria bacterium SG_bin5]